MLCRAGSGAEVVQWRLTVVGLHHGCMPQPPNLVGHTWRCVPHPQSSKILLSKCSFHTRGPCFCTLSSFERSCAWVPAGNSLPAPWWHSAAGGEHAGEQVMQGAAQLATAAVGMQRWAVPSAVCRLNAMPNAIQCEFAHPPRLSCHPPGCQRAGQGWGGAGLKVGFMPSQTSTKLNSASVVYLLNSSTASCRSSKEACKARCRQR